MQNNNNIMRIKDEIIRDDCVVYMYRAKYKLLIFARLFSVVRYIMHRIGEHDESSVKKYVSHNVHLPALRKIAQET